MVTKIVTLTEKRIDALAVATSRRIGASRLSLTAGLKSVTLELRDKIKRKGGD
jgi:hypothetical protein